MSITGWLFAKKTITDPKTEKKKEIVVLEKTQLPLVSRELNYLGEALAILSKITWWSPGFMNNNIARYQVQSGDIANIIRTAEIPLQNARIGVGKISKIAKKIEQDLLDIRGATQNTKADHFSLDELRVVSVCQNISKEIDEIVKELRTMLNFPFRQLDSKYILPDSLGKADRDELKEAGNDMWNKHKYIIGRISWLEKSVKELLELESKIENEYLPAYVDS